MRLAVFSEKAHSHQNFISRALKTGYEITVLTPNPEKITVQHKKLRLIKGEAEDSSVVYETLQQADAVICLFKKHTSLAVKNIIESMQYYDVRRCIFFSEEADSTLSPERRTGILRKLFTQTIPEGIDAIRHSDRDWTILHPFDMDNPPEIHQHIDISDKTIVKIKDNFVNFLLQQITDATHISKVLSI